MTYDANNNLRVVENALGHKMVFDYEKNLLVQITDSLGHKTSYTHNNQGQVLTKTSPREGVTRYAYANGYLVQVTDPEGVVYLMDYDAAGRLINISDVDDHRTTLGYDGMNRLTSVTNPFCIQFG